MDARELAQVKQLIEQMETEDKRLTEQQKGIMRHLISQGMDEHEAKIRVLCIGVAPSNQEVVHPERSPFPRMVYHEDGRLKVAQDEANYKEAKKMGWQDKPLQIHLDNTLAADQKRARITPEAALASVKA